MALLVTVGASFTLHGCSSPCPIATRPHQDLLVLLYPAQGRTLYPYTETLPLKLHSTTQGLLRTLPSSVTTDKLLKLIP